MSDTPPRIVVLGSFMQACCWSVERLPRQSETLRATTFSTEAAGKGLSVAVGCHRLGARVDLLMAIGNDAPADRLLAWLRDEGLDDRLVGRFDQPSGHGAGFVDANGDNQIVVHPGANEALGTSRIAAADDEIAAAGLLYAQLEVPLATVRAALARARSHGVLAVLNPSLASPAGRDPGMRRHPGRQHRRSGSAAGVRAARRPRRAPAEGRLGLARAVAPLAWQLAGGHPGRPGQRRVGPRRRPLRGRALPHARDRDHRRGRCVQRGPVLVAGRRTKHGGRAGDGQRMRRMVGGTSRHPGRAAGSRRARDRAQDRSLSR